MSAPGVSASRSGDHHLVASHHTSASAGSTGVTAVSIIATVREAATRHYGVTAEGPYGG